MDSGNPSKKQIRVTIFNQNYTLRTSGEEGETEELAHTVDDLMNTIAKRSGNVDSSRVAVLACLHLADRLRTLEGNLSTLQERISEKTRNFNLQLDRALDSE